MYLGKTSDWTERREILVDFGLIVKLWELGANFLKFSCQSFTLIGPIFCKVDLSKGTSA